MDSLLPVITPTFLLIIIVITIWDFAWKGLALWIAAKQSQKAWFIALLIFNTVGILPILYIFLFSSKNAYKS